MADMSHCCLLHVLNCTLIVTAFTSQPKSKTLKIQLFCKEVWREVHFLKCVNMPTSLSHEPVAKISGSCRSECDTGRHFVLLIFWDTYLAFILSMEPDSCVKLTINY